MERAINLAETLEKQLIKLRLLAAGVEYSGQEQVRGKAKKDEERKKERLAGLGGQRHSGTGGGRRRRRGRRRGRRLGRRRHAHEHLAAHWVGYRPRAGTLPGPYPARCTRW